MFLLQVDGEAYSNNTVVRGSGTYVISAMDANGCVSSPVSQNLVNPTGIFVV